jgi:hypothetical protein
MVTVLIPEEVLITAQVRHTCLELSYNQHASQVHYDDNHQQLQFITYRIQPGEQTVACAEHQVLEMEHSVLQSFIQSIQPS